MTWYGGSEPASGPSVSPPLPEWPGVDARHRGSSERRSRLAPVVLVGVLSAVLAATGTYSAIEISLPAAAPAATRLPGPTSAPAAFTSVTTTDVVKVAALARPSVVTITTSGVANLSPFAVPTSGAGSGIVVSADGLILTNDHVIADSGSLQVLLADGRTVPGTVVSADPRHDLAIVRASASGLTPARLGESGRLTVGQLAVAIGSPLGTFTDTVTEGIISGLNRSVTVTDSATRQRNQLQGLIQTDAAINPGNSGGPLLDAAGDVVGVITAEASDAQGVGFAIPIAVARDFIRRATGR